MVDSRFNDEHPVDDWADAMADDEEFTGVIRITEVQEVDPCLQPRDRAALTVVSGPDTGRVFPIIGEPILGRGRHCEVRIEDNSVSRAHAQVVKRGDLCWVIEDRGSRNGTFVNGRRIQWHELHDGDGIQLGGSVRFRFTLSNVEEEGVFRKLYESSVRDGLTGAFNRKHFNERLAMEISYAIRHRTELSLVMYDIDHFKRVNDTYGHLGGDLILSKLTGVIQHTIRTEDLLARYGGEEFAVIARGIGAEGAVCLGERIRAMAERSNLRFEGQFLHVTVSVGVATLATLRGEQTAHRLIGQADANLYAAKQGGRNRVVG